MPLFFYTLGFPSEMFPVQTCVVFGIKEIMSEKHLY